MPVTLTDDEAAALEQYIHSRGFDYAEGGTIGVILMKCIHRDEHPRPLDSDPRVTP